MLIGLNFRKSKLMKKNINYVIKITSPLMIDQYSNRSFKAKANLFLGKKLFSRLLEKGM